MDNLVEKLRKYAINQHGWIDIDDTCEAAADEIERLRIENIQMRFALGYPMPSHLEYHIIPQNPFKCGICDARLELNDD